MTTIVELCSQNNRSVLFICDFSPPKGSNPELFKAVTHLNADIISVAYNPGKSVRVSSPFAAHWIRQVTGKEILFTLATRDMNKVAIESLILGADLLGLDNMMVVRGDKFNEIDSSLTSSVYDFSPTEMIAAAVKMNQGVDYKGSNLFSSTNLCIGASIDLGREFEQETRLLHRKINAGAQFFLLQTLFEPRKLEHFLLSYADRYGEKPTTPIFCGVQILTDNSPVFSNIPGWVTQDLSKGRSGEDIACHVISNFTELGFNSIYLVPPVWRGGRRDYEAAQRVMEAFNR